MGVDGKTLSTLPVISGVPQGSVFEPLLFLVYIDGLAGIQLSDGTLILFADDIVVYRPIRDPSDFVLLQGDVNTISDWIKSNLNLNAKKCKQMVITRKKHPSSPVNLILDGKALEMVNAYRYLGVWVSDLSWTK